MNDWFLLVLAAIGAFCAFRCAMLLERIESLTKEANATLAALWEEMRRMRIDP